MLIKSIRQYFYIFMYYFLVSINRGNFSFRSNPKYRVMSQGRRYFLPLSATRYADDYRILSLRHSTNFIGRQVLGVNTEEYQVCSLRIFNAIFYLRWIFHDDVWSAQRMLPNQLCSYFVLRAVVERLNLQDAVPRELPVYTIRQVASLKRKKKY